jgi:8-oxo-dGTP pyrophosphatase MutT (NUDIX family)
MNSIPPRWGFRPKVRLSDPVQSLIDGLSRPGRPSSDYDLNADVAPPAGVTLRPAAVLVAVDVTGADPQVILTKRSARLKHHPGQIAFPGGAIDPGDADATDAALREADEEIGLPRDCFEPLGTLPAHETVTRYSITPVVGLVREPFTERPEPGEVDEVFRTPLSYLLDPGSFRVEGRIWQGRHRRYYAVPWGPYYIWGATARILRALADRVAG